MYDDDVWVSAFQKNKIKLDCKIRKIGTIIRLEIVNLPTIRTK